MSNQDESASFSLILEASQMEDRENYLRRGRYLKEASTDELAEKLTNAMKLSAADNSNKDALQAMCNAVAEMRIRGISDIQKIMTPFAPLIAAQMLNYFQK
jgi:hypothetical protein